MANVKDVEEQLKRIGCNFRFWGRWEVKELANVILPDEVIEYCVNGIYDGGFAMLAATDQRLLLVDKKPMYLTLEDVRYDMVSELDFNRCLLNSTLRVCTPNKDMRFTSYNGDRLRELFHFTQHSVMLIRQYYAQQREQSSPLVYDRTTKEVDGSDHVAAQVLPQQDQPALTLPRFQQNNDRSQSTQQPNPIPWLADIYQSDGIHPGHITMSGMKRVVPIINAYTKLPFISRQTSYLGSSRVGIR